MKKFILTFLIVHYSVFIVFSQAPQMFKYQTVIRDSSGNLIVNKQIVSRISILKGNSSGTVVYQEQQNLTTNQYGLVSIDIGSGTNKKGSFSKIDWGTNTFYVKIEADITGGLNFHTSGICQLLSVPYALYAGKAGSIPMMTDTQRDTIKNPNEGFVIYNITTKCLNIFNGNNWFQYCSDKSNCVPKPTKADAGTNQINVSGTTTTLAGNTPLAGTGLWTIQSGTGGNIQTPSSPTSTFTGIAGNTYGLRWTISNQCGNSYADVTISFKAGGNCDNVTDYDGNNYNAITKGRQCWMQQNLKTTRFNDGTAIPLVTDDSVWKSLTTPGYCWYNDSIKNKSIYGGLYNWFAVSAGKLCPSGWHVPTYAEWDTLVIYLGGLTIADGKMKEAGTTHWVSPNTEADNSSSFTALPGGDRYYSNGFFYNLGNDGYWWSATEINGTHTWHCCLGYDYPGVYLSGISKSYGFSVRCVKD